MKRLWPILSIVLMAICFWCVVFVALTAHTIPIGERTRNTWLLKLALLEYQEDRNGR